ncbi:hypothetical protein [Brevibacillus dissolubilis]|uniref:hypothetical protein n=1 Tax=Brevibacillus dissolubilis TaxID=1844116 RepID=UPI0011171CBD|nr:hypothetical protein [Brevibacillus dissolubilis]
MKKYLAVAFAATVLSFAGVSAVQTYTASADLTVSSVEADYVVFNSLEEMEKYAPIVVEAKFNGKRGLKEWKVGESVQKASETFVEIKKVHKGDVKKGQTLNVYEPAFTGDGLYQAIEGYNLMDEKGKYVLFLRPDMNGEGYVLVGMYQGKHDLNITEAATQVNAHSFSELEGKEYFGDMAGQFNKLKGEVVAKYGK